MKVKVDMVRLNQTNAHLLDHSSRMFISLLNNRGDHAENADDKHEPDLPTLGCRLSRLVVCAPQSVDVLKSPADNLKRSLWCAILGAKLAAKNIVARELLNGATPQLLLVNVPN